MQNLAPPRSLPGRAEAPCRGHLRSRFQNRSGIDQNGFELGLRAWASTEREKIGDELRSTLPEHLNEPNRVGYPAQVEGGATTESARASGPGVRADLAKHRTSRGNEDDPIPSHFGV
jgi:hypothetical protein